MPGKSNPIIFGPKWWLKNGYESHGIPFSVKNHQQQQIQVHPWVIQVHPWVIQVHPWVIQVHPWVIQVHPWVI